MATETNKVTITPKRAAELLAHNSRNRRLDRKNVQRWVRVIKNGQWDEDAAIFQVLEDGNLGNGQHRLTAIAETGVTVKAWLMTGVKESTLHYIDTGRSRTQADVLTMRGVPNASTTASGARGFMHLQQNMMESSMPDFTPAEVDDFIGGDWEYWGALYTSARRIYDRCGGGSIQALCAAMEYVRRTNDPLVEVWEEMMVFGYHIEPGSPAASASFALGRVGRLDGNSGRRGRGSQFKSAYLYVKGFEHFRKGNKVQGLPISSKARMPRLNKEGK